MCRMGQSVGSSKSYLMQGRTAGAAPESVLSCAATCVFHLLWHFVHWQLQFQFAKLPYTRGEDVDF